MADYLLSFYRLWCYFSLLLRLFACIRCGVDFEVMMFVIHTHRFIGHDDPTLCQKLFDRTEN